MDDKSIWNINKIIGYFHDMNYISVYLKLLQMLKKRNEQNLYFQGPKKYLFASELNTEYSNWSLIYSTLLNRK